MGDTAGNPDARSNPNEALVEGYETEIDRIQTYSELAEFLDTADFSPLRSGGRGLAPESVKEMCTVSFAALQRYCAPVSLDSVPLSDVEFSKLALRIAILVASVNQRRSNNKSVSLKPAEIDILATATSLNETDSKFAAIFKGFRTAIRFKAAEEGTTLRKLDLTILEEDM